MSTPAGFDDWPQILGETVLLKQQLNELDPDVNPYSLPHVAAGDAAVSAANTRLGRRLDPLHEQLLRHADGWSDYFVFTHLFGTGELGADGPWRAAEDLLDIYYSDGPPIADFPDRSNVYCIAADAAQVEDLFVVWGLGPVTDGGRPVSWLADDEVQRFANVHEWALAVIDYSREDLAKLRTS